VEVTGAPLPRNLKARRSRKSNPRFSALFKSVSLNGPNYLNNSTEPNETAYNPKENTYSENCSNFKD
jgi:hypothetical protein